MANPETLENTSAQLLVEAPAVTKSVAVFLPGVSGGAFSERYRPLLDACTTEGIAVARLSSYADADVLKNKTIAELHADIDTAISYLKAHGYTSLFGIGKSFGGALMLTHQSQDIKRKVLWAPAIAAVEQGGNSNAYLRVPVGSIPTMMDVCVGRSFLEKIETPTLLIHGTADDQIPFANSEKMAAMLPNAQLIPVNGADHSYKNPEHERAVTAATVKFLKN